MHSSAGERGATPLFGSAAPDAHKSRSAIRQRDTPVAQLAARHVDLTASTLAHAPAIVGCALPSPSTFCIKNAKVMGFEFAQLGGEPKYLVKLPELSESGAIARSKGQPGQVTRLNSAFPPLPPIPPLPPLHAKQVSSHVST